MQLAADSKELSQLEKKLDEIQKELACAQTHAGTGVL
jgi:hypothetical protein